MFLRKKLLSINLKILLKNYIKKAINIKLYSPYVGLLSCPFQLLVCLFTNKLAQILVKLSFSGIRSKLKPGFAKSFKPFSCTFFSSPPLCIFTHSFPFCVTLITVPKLPSISATAPILGLTSQAPITFRHAITCDQ